MSLKFCAFLFFLAAAGGFAARPLIVADSNAREMTVDQLASLLKVDIWEFDLDPPNDARRLQTDIVLYRPDQPPKILATTTSIFRGETEPLKVQFIVQHPRGEKDSGELYMLVSEGGATAGLPCDYPFESRLALNTLPTPESIGASSFALYRQNAQNTFGREFDRTKDICFAINFEFQR